MEVRDRIPYNPAIHIWKNVKTALFIAMKNWNEVVFQDMKVLHRILWNPLQQFDA